MEGSWYLIFLNWGTTWLPALTEKEKKKKKKKEKKRKAPSVMLL
jgi:hypothetical protein